MKIKELIAVLKSAPDFERDVYIISMDKYFTTSIGASFDDNNDIQVYEVGSGLSEE
jgi:hypothetical protein